jgi:uncharacterized protein (TIGR02186 family)
VRARGAIAGAALLLAALAATVSAAIPAFAQTPPPAAGAAAAGSASNGQPPAQKLVTTLSPTKILIQSNFAGQALTVFGAIEDSDRSANYDAVVTIKGPRGAVTVRRKQRWGPFWFNLDNRKYIGIPAYIAVLSNRDVREIASAAVREDLHIGINALIPQQVARRGANDPEFRAALQRLRREQELFQEDPEGVTFVSPRVFQASINLPGRVPLGRYEVEVAIFTDGALEARQNLTFEVSKTDLEQAIATSAREHPIGYGLVIIFMALLLGWIASVIFRRD